jgi:hypothetical protein
MSRPELKGYWPRPTTHTLAGKGQSAVQVVLLKWAMEWLNSLTTFLRCFGRLLRAHDLPAGDDVEKLSGVRGGRGGGVRLPHLVLVRIGVPSKQQETAAQEAVPVTASTLQNSKTGCQDIVRKVLMRRRPKHNPAHSKQASKNQQLTGSPRKALEMASSTLSKPPTPPRRSSACSHDQQTQMRAS